MLYSSVRKSAQGDRGSDDRLDRPLLHVGQHRSTTWPPRWFRPRTGGLSFSNLPRPGALASLRQRPSCPFSQTPPAGPCARPPHKPQRSRWMLSHPAPPRLVPPLALWRPTRRVVAPSSPAHPKHPQREALGVVDQARKVDQVGCSHDERFSHEQVSCSRFCARTRCLQPYFPVPPSPPRNPTGANGDRQSQWGTSRPDNASSPSTPSYAKISLSASIFAGSSSIPNPGSKGAWIMPCTGSTGSRRKC